MKKYFILMASAVLVLAASCNKLEDGNTSVEKEFITVKLNPVPRTTLSGTTTVWSDKDAVSVTVGGKNIGTLTLKSGNTFSGEIEAGHSGKAVLNYPAGVTSVPTVQAAVKNSFANNTALLEGETTVEALRAGQGATLLNKTALLQFSVTINGDAAITIGDKTYTITGCKAGEEYYACVEPSAAAKMTYSVGVALGANEKPGFAPEANVVYPLGTLTLKESIYGLIGVNGDWDNDIKMYETSQDNFYVAYGVAFSAAAEFKIRKAGAWIDDYNFGTTTTAKKSANSVIGVYTDGGSKNISVNAGTYDIYFDRLAGQVYLMEAGKAHTTATKQTTTTKYALTGSFVGSNWDDSVQMTYSGDGIWTNVQEFSANDQFKVKNYGNWSASWGYSNVYPGQGLVSNSEGNAKVKTAGTYVIGFYKAGNKITMVAK